MSADRECKALLHPDSPSGSFGCELTEWHEGDHYIFDNTKDGITWPLNEADLLGRETRRLADRLERILRSVDCDDPIDVSIGPDSEDGFRAGARLEVRHLRAVLDVIDRRTR